MRIGKRFVASALLGAVALSASQSRGAVGLSITDTSGPPDSALVTPGVPFSFTVSITVSQNEEPTGLDYFLRSSSIPAGFRVTGRDFTNSVFPDQNNTSLDATESILDPDTATLGATRDVDAFGNPKLGNGTFRVATFTLTAGAGAPAGIYTIRTASATTPDNPNVGYSTTTGERAFDQHGTYTVTVVPEPAGLTAAVIGAGLLALGRRRSRRS